MSEETKTLLPVQIDPTTIVTLIQANVPQMVSIRDKAVGRMSEITEIKDAEDEAELTGVLIASAKAIDRVMNLRMEITKITDELKSQSMVYEKDIKEHDARLRAVLQKYRQEELDRKKKIEDEAKAKKAKEDHKIDLESQIKKNLSQMVIAITVESEDWSKAFFDKATVANFDAEAKKFMGLKPSLKAERYENQFKVSYNRNVISDKEFTEFLLAIKERPEFSYVYWTQAVIQLVTATLNGWRARIDELKAEKIQFDKAGEAEKARLTKEKAERDEQDSLHKKTELENLQKQADDNIANEAMVSKMSNAFVEQATVQQAGDKGLVKKVLKFSDPAKTMKAFATIVAMSMSHKDFPGIQKKDAKKVLQFDDNGRPEYVEAVQWWINFFLAKCDAEVDGVVISEDSKVIVRK